MAEALNSVCMICTLDCVGHVCVYVCVFACVCVCVCENVCALKSLTKLELKRQTLQNQMYL